jgi:dihydroorotase
MTTITIQIEEKGLLKSLIAFCKALGIRSYQVENSAKTDNVKLRTDIEKHAQTFATGSREGLVRFENTDDLKTHFGL